MLDEFDAIAKLRDDPQEVGEIKRVVNSLLQNLDDRADIGITVAITNHHRLLDTAVWRRFENQIQLSLPDMPARLTMLSQFLKPLPASQVLHQLIAYVTDGRSGSDLRRLANGIKRGIALAGSEASPAKQFKMFCQVLEREPAARIHPLAGKLVDDIEEFVALAMQDSNFTIKQKPLASLLDVNQATVSRWMRKTISPREAVHAS